MSVVRLENVEGKPVQVRVLRRHEGGWGEAHDQTINSKEVLPGGRVTLSIGGDLRGGGTLIEIYELP